MKKFFKIIFSRAAVSAVFVVMQLLALYFAITLLNNKVSFFYAACLLFSAAVVLYLVSRDGNPAYKIAWIIPIMALPVFGTLLYLVFGKNRLTLKERGRMASVDKAYNAAMDEIAQEAASLDGHENASRMSEYIRHAARTPPFGHTETTYLPIGEAMLERLLQELKKAEHFIFMEYYIIRPGQMWEAIHAVLLEKAKQGLDVRMMYDDFGCMFKLPDGYDRVLEAEGIRCCVFNRFKPILSPRFNNRDHRKICVIDGNVGFTGGINLSDEYVNAAERCGHWLDSAVLLRGQGVFALTAMFLSVWDYVKKESDAFRDFAPDAKLCAAISAPGCVQPFTDAPLDDEAVGETVYMQLINRAVDYVYINTPYLIIDNEMLTALTTAAKSGVDVRLVTPAICDSKLVQEMTRSHYAPLIAAGVKVYEYTPGMVHAKTFVCDDRYGVIGTINLDYRSLYLHFECAAWMYRTEAVPQMKAAYLSELERCELITMETCRSQGKGKQLRRAILRTLAPLF